MIPPQIRAAHGDGRRGKNKIHRLLAFLVMLWLQSEGGRRGREAYKHGQAEFLRTWVMNYVGQLLQVSSASGKAWETQPADITDETLSFVQRRLDTKQECEPSNRSTALDIGAMKAACC